MKRITRIQVSRHQMYLKYMKNISPNVEIESLINRSTKVTCGCAMMMHQRPFSLDDLQHFKI